MPTFRIEIDCRRCEGRGVEDYQFKEGHYDCWPCYGSGLEVFWDEYENVEAVTEDYPHAHSIAKSYPTTADDGYEIGRKILGRSA